MVDRFCDTDYRCGMYSVDNRGHYSWQLCNFNGSLRDLVETSNRLTNDYFPALSSAFPSSGWLVRRSYSFASPNMRMWNRDEHPFYVIHRKFSNIFRVEIYHYENLRSASSCDVFRSLEYIRCWFTYNCKGGTCPSSWIGGGELGPVA